MNNDYQFQNDPNNGGMPPVNLGPARTGRNMATVSMILALVSIAMMFAGCCGFNLIPAVLAIVFSITSRRRDGAFSGVALAGLIIGIVSLVLSLIVLVLAVYIGIQIVNDPEGTVAKAFNDAFYSRYGMSFEEYMDRILGATAE